MVGCIGDLYTSVESLSSDYLQPNIKTDSILNPKVGASSSLLSLTDAQTADKHSKSFYVCNSKSRETYIKIHKYVTDSPGQKCPQCSSSMSSKVVYVVPEESVDVVTSSEGYVKGVVTYIVTDNLEVKPMSTISSITMINEFGINDISSLVEKQVKVTHDEGLAILKASLETKAVLTTVFLTKTDQRQSQNQSREKKRKR